MSFKMPSKHYPQKRISKTANISLDINYIGSGCGAVRGAVASNTRDPRFESSHRQIIFSTHCTETTKK